MQNLPKTVYRGTPAGIAPGILEVPTRAAAASTTGTSLTSPLTTKGDIWGYDTTNDRIPVGTDGQVLLADSTTSLGVRWVNAGLPYWAIYYYASNAMGAVLLDSTFFINGGTNIPGGISVRTSRENAEVDGSYVRDVSNAQHVFWASLPLVNGNAVDTTIHYDVEAFDDTIALLNEYQDNLAGTVGVTAATGAVLGSGTAFNTDFAVGDYIKLASGDLLRITVITDATHMTTAIGLAGNLSTQTYKLAKKLYSSATASAAANQYVSAILKAGKTHTIHIIGNNNDVYGFWLVKTDALITAGITTTQLGFNSGGGSGGGGGGTGTVTSVGLTVPSELSVAGSPVTTSGTLAVTWATQTQNKFFMSPVGSTGVPTFRALATADLPANVVTNAKLAQMANKTYKGRHTAGTGDPEDVSVANLISDLALHRGCLITLCAGFTPAGTGADVAEFMVPYDPADGTTSLTWTIERINFRVGTAGGAPSVKLQKSSAGDAVFGAGTDVATLTQTSGHWQTNATGSLGTVASGDLLRFNVVTLATATAWTIDVLLSATLNS